MKISEAKDDQPCRLLKNEKLPEGGFVDAWWRQAESVRTEDA